jgi:hypothetical protein
VTSPAPSALRRELDKRAFLIEQVGTDRFDLSALPPNRRAWLAQTGWQSTNQALAAAPKTTSRRALSRPASCTTHIRRPV